MRASARALATHFVDLDLARKTGETAPAGTPLVLYPCAREGGALSDHSANKTEGPLLRQRVEHEHTKTPPPKRRGVVDRFRSVAVTAGPDQREAVVALALHQ